DELSSAALALGLGLAAAWAAGIFPRPKVTAAVLAFLIGWAGIHGTVRQATELKTRSLASGILRETIETRESWARFLLEESLKTLDRAKRDILAYLDGSFDLPDSARRLWNETPAGRFRWYSSLEIQAADGTLLSRYALNVPKIFRPTADLPSRPRGSIVRRILPFMGKGKDFLIGYRDWEAEGKILGRTVMSMSLDDDLLPFLYSSNPYFELLRSNTLPSLVQFDFRLAIFDASGRLVFNPGNLSSGLPPGVMERSDLDGSGVRADFRDKNERFDLFAFRSDGRVYAVLTPRPGLIGWAAEYFKFLFLAGLLLVPAALAVAWIAVRRTRRRPLWSFADRVYVSFAAVALVPLLLFAVFSRGFFNRIFTQQFIRKAEIHANLARNVMDDFAALEEEGQFPLETPPDDLVLWISTTISNDVNLYRGGRLVSSSRRELFDAGLLPELLDGEIHFQIQFADHPYYAQTSRLGSFSFRTLTVPYPAIEPPLLLSLPFPFERQEISAAGRELFEVLIFIGVIFIGTVLLLARGIGAMIVTPVHRLLAGTREAALGNLEFEVEYRGRDEMKTLVDGFNAMIRNLKCHQQEMTELGRKAAWAEMARKVAHEVKNPLTPIQLSAEHLLHVWTDRPGEFEPALKESISYIVGEVDNLRRIAQDFLDLSRAAVLNKESLALDAILIETLAPYKTLLSDRLVFREAIEPGLAFEGDRDKLRIAFRNLIINAIESIRLRGEVRVEARREGGRFQLTFGDTGSGMRRDVLDRIFEPHFSTKSSGTGLGLPITKKIIEDHGGTIRVRSEAGLGTSVFIELPAEGAAAILTRE
ncbi:MAG: HAMP domain-containing histidine kinase, partial [Candidatus Aminicenantes bacterium]|nr:HAMP domain-containing histidine kinase [Candidatus Aminicenantes bacterium]